MRRGGRPPRGPVLVTGVGQCVAREKTAEPLSAAACTTCAECRPRHQPRGGTHLSGQKEPRPRSAPGHAPASGMRRRTQPSSPNLRIQSGPPGRESWNTSAWKKLTLVKTRTGCRTEGSVSVVVAPESRPREGGGSDSVPTSKTQMLHQQLLFPKKRELSTYSNPKPNHPPQEDGPEQQHYYYLLSQNVSAFQH